MAKIDEDLLEPAIFNWTLDDFIAQEAVIAFSAKTHGDYGMTNIEKYKILLREFDEIDRVGGEIPDELYDSLNDAGDMLSVEELEEAKKYNYELRSLWTPQERLIEANNVLKSLTQSQLIHQHYWIQQRDKAFEDISREKVDKCIKLFKSANNLFQFRAWDDYSLSIEEANDFYAGLSDAEKVIVIKRIASANIQG